MMFLGRIPTGIGRPGRPVLTLIGVAVLARMLTTQTVFPLGVIRCHRASGRPRSLAAAAGRGRDGCYSGVGQDVDGLPSGVITACGKDEVATGRRGPLIVPTGVIRPPSLSTHAAGRLPGGGQAGPGLPKPPCEAGATMTATLSAATLRTVARVGRRRRRMRPAGRPGVATGPSFGP